MLFTACVKTVLSKKSVQHVCHVKYSYHSSIYITIQNAARKLSSIRDIQYKSKYARSHKGNKYFNDFLKIDRQQRLKEINNLQGCLSQGYFHITRTYFGAKNFSCTINTLNMESGSEQSFMVNRVGTVGDTVSKLSPDRTSTKSLSTNSSNSAIGGHDSKMPFIIGVAGGTASGKTTVCEKIIEAVTGHQDFGHERQVISLSQDSFYRELNPSESKKAEKGLFNFDHPDAFDHDLMLSCLEHIRAGKSTKIPLYDYKTNSRVKDKFTIIHPSDVVLLEGILVFYHKDVMNMFDMKLFVDTDADTRLARRVLRDIEDRGRDLEQVLHQYTTLVKPAFEEFCLPTKKHADVIIPRGADNTVAISLVAQHIKDIIHKRNGSCDCNNKSSTPNGSSGSSSGSPFTRSRSNSDSVVVR